MLGQKSSKKFRWFEDTKRNFKINWPLGGNPLLKCKLTLNGLDFNILDLTLKRGPFEFLEASDRMNVQ